MNLLLVDDHALFREGLRALLLNISPELTIYEAASVDGAIDECKSTEFRMVLLDLQLSSSDGLDTLESFRSSVPNVPVVVLSGSEEPQRIRAAIERGAVGYVPKSHTSDLMIAALRLVLSGGVYLPPVVLDSPVDLSRAADLTGAQPFARLSPRQHQVAQLLLQGQPNKVIARQLGLSEGTIKAHVSAIYQIIGAKNRVEAVTLAAKSGIAVM
jgi:two-component system, NarL family, nitrate/nitrite response regulator NarL